eukprot:GHVP01014550.1.p1 GENE.GHVP01014550.1~~GHVP01014550.1.p1  ORF type:complete len:455 (+),score=102.64 GHVP01014550.1:445-1809(+)
MKKAQNKDKSKIETNKLLAIASKKKLDKKEREEVIFKLFSKVEDNVEALLKNQTDIRLLETCFKYGSQSQKEYIFKEIEQKLQKLCSDRLGYHLIVSIIKNSASHKLLIEESISSITSKLILTKEGTAVISAIYKDLSKTKQMDFLKQNIEKDLEKTAERLVEKCLLNSKVTLDTISLYISTCRVAVVDLLIYELLDYLKENTGSIVELEGGVLLITRLLVFSSENGRGKLLEIYESDAAGYLCNVKTRFLGEVLFLLAIKEEKEDIIENLEKILKSILSNNEGENSIRYFISGRAVRTDEEKSILKAIDEDDLRKGLLKALSKNLKVIFKDELICIGQCDFFRTLSDIYIELEFDEKVLSGLLKNSETLSDPKAKKMISNILYKTKEEEIADSILVLLKNEKKKFLSNECSYLLSTIWEIFPEKRAEIENLIGEKGEKEESEGLLLLRKKQLK